MWRDEVDSAHRWSNIILKPVLLLLSCVYETCGLYTRVRSYDIMTVITTGCMHNWATFWSWDTYTCISWLSMDIRDPICIIDMEFIGSLLSRATLSTNREWTKIQIILSAIMKFLIRKNYFVYSSWKSACKLGFITCHNIVGKRTGQCTFFFFTFATDCRQPNFTSTFLPTSTILLL